eukprot:CAMPEP_0183752890 /NCGR_PEP_ID=MMETSP0739-20130205/2605_1 /TAXON_ID=385413 /ORGANISM="Thalassiosira miniscula, Strain CCMP1093" /LENGTH=422 /DNA_ID=CAMNT_0025989299 /DNA_START=38 /DNA_END=1306 /DNA_ORIENTATION=+
MGMKIESKKTPEAEDEEAAASMGEATSSSAVDKKSKKKKEKKSKKSKSKKRSREEKEEDEEEVQQVTENKHGSNNDNTDPTKDSAKRQRKAERLAKKTDILSQIPTVDPETGIPYSKIQLRRMKRRVKNGLAPIATEEEEREIRAREKRERLEEEALYASGTTANEDENENAADANDNADEDDVDNDDEKESNDRTDQEDEVEEAREVEPKEDEEGTTSEEPKPKKKNHNPPSKNTPRSKPVPPDYVCMACNNELPDFKPHWIYDCPIKKTRKGCNQVAKRLRGLHDPPSRKVFVSGLPFDCNEGSVKRFFEESMLEKSRGDGAVAELVHCKLLKFEDSQRCKGTAFLTFDSDEGAKLALTLNGSNWKEVEEPGTKSKTSKKNKKKMDVGEGKNKELKLKVTKVLNRHVTKRAKTKGGQRGR